MRILRKIILLFFQTLVLITAGACGRQETSLTPTPALLTAGETSAVPTATIDWFPRTPTPTFSASASPPDAVGTTPAPAHGELLFADDFTDDTLWQSGIQSAGNITVASGTLTTALKGEKGLIASASQHTLPSSFYLEITVDVSLCSEGDQYGLLLWQNSVAGTYRLWANCAGELRLDRQIYASVGVIQDWQPARKFQPGEAARNRFGLLADAGELQVYINDTLQFSVPIRQDLQGPLGIVAQSAGNGASTFLFSNLVVSKP